MSNQSNPFTRGVQDFFGGLGGNRPNSSNPSGGRPASNRVESFFGSMFASAEEQFEALTQAAMRESLRDQQQQPRGPPPTSPNALKKLPLIQIKPDDLIDPANRECSICLEKHNLSETAVRLPCAHIFHRPCVIEWLEQHCTCPVCRYELPTEDDAFERGRKERMRNRRPRYAMHELERLSIRELKEMLLPDSRYQPVDRDDLVNQLISTGAIDLVASPEPVCYSLSALRQMKASRLKKCMNEEAGVFFDSKDVVEKDDMIEILINSGRLDLLPEDEPDDTMSQMDNCSTMSNSNFTFERRDTAAPVGRFSVETVDEDSEQLPEDLRVDTTILMEESQSSVSQNNLQNSTAEEMSLKESATQSAEVVEDRLQSEGTTEVEHCDNLLSSENTTSENSDLSSGSLPEMNNRLLSDQSEVGEESISASASTASTESTPNSNRSTSSQSLSGKKRHLSPRNGAEVPSQFDEMSISELRRTGHQLSVDLSDCLERSEMIERLGNASRQQERNLAHASTPMLSYLADLTMSDLRLLICVVGTTSPVIGWEREDLIHQLAAEVQNRPYAEGLIEALIPFLSLSVSQLRSVARERRIDLSDCIEKAEMLRRLTSGSSH